MDKTMTGAQVQLARYSLERRRFKGLSPSLRPHFTFAVASSNKEGASRGFSPSYRWHFPFLLLMDRTMQFHARTVFVSLDINDHGIILMFSVFWREKMI